MRPVKLRSRRARLFTNSRRAQLIAQAAALVALGTLWIGVPGCMENIALIGRPTIEEGQDDVVGEVERVDIAARRLYLRANKSARRVVALSADAQVFDRGREYPITRLKPGDVVATQIKRDSRGEPYADLLRIQENAAGQSSRGVPGAAPRIETLAGTVESVNRRDNSFELDDRSGPPVVVRLSEYIRDSDRERFRTLRAGARVRIEGKFTARDRFEMLSFLNTDDSY
jgi:hypothetical protein